MDLTFASDIGNQGLVIELLRVAKDGSRDRNRIVKGKPSNDIGRRIAGAGEALRKPGASYNFDLFG
jgi:hypothetical protein